MARVGTTLNALLDRLTEDRARVRRLAAQVISAQDEERARVARELHDSTAQMLTARDAPARRRGAGEHVARARRAHRDAARAGGRGARGGALAVAHHAPARARRPRPRRRAGVAGAPDARAGRRSTCEVFADADSAADPARRWRRCSTAWRRRRCATRRATPRRGTSSCGCGARRDARRRSRWRTTVAASTCGAPRSAGRAWDCSPCGSGSALVNGTLAVTSAPGRGTRVVATVPLTDIDWTGARHDAIRVVLVDDHAIVRTGLKAVLGAAPEIDVVGEASGGQRGGRAARRTRRPTWS